MRVAGVVRWWLVVALTIGGVAVVVAAYVVASQLSAADADDGGADVSGVVPDRTGLRQAMPSGGHLLVRAVDPEAPRGDGPLYEVHANGRFERVANTKCKRVHAAPSGETICLGLGPNLVDYRAIFLSADYKRGAWAPVHGVPDRARVSPDGRYAAYTVFDAEESFGYFESAGDFTVYTRILDTATGRTVRRLEDLDIRRDGKSIGTDEDELWGVTFGEGGRFYATAMNRGSFYLIEGNVASERARVIRRRVECPALSPDGTRIAYKRRIAGTNRWRFHVLDLATGETNALAERRSIDDQPEWLGDDWIVYSDDDDVFAARADGSGEAIRLVGRATSPAAL